MNFIQGMVSNTNVVPKLTQSLHQMASERQGAYGMAVHGRQGENMFLPRLHRVQCHAHGPNDASSHNKPKNGLQGLTGMGQFLMTDLNQQQSSSALPHFSCGPNADLNTPPKVAVVCQGHLENQTSLRESLVERGYAFRGNSDGELIAHLLDATNQNDPLQAVQRLLGLVNGVYGVGILFQAYPDRLIAAQQGTPMYLSIGPDHLGWSSGGPKLNSQEISSFFAMSDGDVLDMHHQTYQIIRA